MEQLQPENLEEPSSKGFALHNLVGHPLMQIFIWLHLPTWADWIHDKTLPQDKINDD
jgi:hypothetical protein